MILSNTVQPKRGYLANIRNIPPLVYPFQYNPVELIDSKKVEYEKNPTKISAARGIEGLKSGISKSSFTSKGGLIGTAASIPERLGRTFSAADLLRFKSEGERTLNFKFVIDGREKRPGEPQRRREDGTIRSDLAILRSFVYPHGGEILDILKTAFGSHGISADASKEKNELNWVNLWFNEPPTALLVMGDLNVEGYVTELKITVTLFDADLNPVRAIVDITMIEKIDSLTFIIDSIKRQSRTFYYSAYEDTWNTI